MAAEAAVPEADLAAPAAVAAASEEAPAEDAVPAVPWAVCTEAPWAAAIWEGTDNPLHHPQWAADGTVVPITEVAAAAAAP